MENEYNILNELGLQDEKIPEDNEHQRQEFTGLAAKLQKVQDQCKDTLDRIRKDLAETNGNPYIRATSIYRYDIYRTAEDQEPIDSFSIEKSNGCTLRAFLLASSLVAAADIAIKSHFWRK